MLNSFVGVINYFEVVSLCCINMKVCLYISMITNVSFIEQSNVTIISRSERVFFLKNMNNNIEM